VQTNSMIKLGFFLPSREDIL